MSSNLGFSIEVKGSSKAVQDLNQTTSAVEQLDKANDRLKQKDPSKFFERQAAAMGMASKQSNQLAKSYEVLTNRSNTATISATNLTGVLSGFAAITAASRLIEMADAMALMHQRATVLAGGVEQGKKAFADMFDTAQRLGVSMTSVADSFTRMSPAMRQLGVDTQGTIQAVETLGKIIQLSGVSVQQANAGMLQFSQALASGKLSGDEFRSISENTPEVLNRLAASLGVTYGELRKMSTEGKLTSEVLTKFLGESAASVDRDFKKLPETVGKSLQRLSNAFATEIDKINQYADGSGSITASFAQGLNSTAKNIDVVIAAVGSLAALLVGRYAGGMAQAISASQAWKTVTGETVRVQQESLKALQQQAIAEEQVAATQSRLAINAEQRAAKMVQERELSVAIARDKFEEARVNQHLADTYETQGKAQQKVDAAYKNLQTQTRLLSDANANLASATEKANSAFGNYQQAIEVTKEKTVALEQAKNKASFAMRTFSAASSAAGAAMTALGGPIGVITGLVLALAVNWDKVTLAATNAQKAMELAANAPTRMGALIEKGSVSGVNEEYDKIGDELSDQQKKLEKIKELTGIISSKQGAMSAGGKNLLGNMVNPLGQFADAAKYRQILKEAGVSYTELATDQEGAAKKLMAVEGEYARTVSNLSSVMSNRNRDVALATQRDKALAAATQDAGRTAAANAQTLKEEQEQREKSLKFGKMSGDEIKKLIEKTNLLDQYRKEYAEGAAKQGITIVDKEKQEAYAIEQTEKALAKKDKTGRAAAKAQEKLVDSYQQKLLEISQVQAKGELQVNNLLEGRTKNYGEHQAALQEQLVLDKELSKLSEDKKVSLMEQARIADELIAKAQLLNRLTDYTASIEEDIYQAKLEMANLGGERGIESELERADKYAKELLDTFGKLRVNPLTGLQEKFIDDPRILDKLQKAKEAGAAKDDYTFSRQFAEQQKANKDQLANMEFAISLMGKTRAEKERLNAVRQIEQDYEKEILNIVGEGEPYERRKAQLLAQQAQQIAAINDLYAQQEAQRQNWQAGMQEGMNKYFDEITNFSEMVQSATEKAFKGVEDAFVKAAQTGKLSFKDMLKEIEADIIRMIVRKGMTEMFGTPSKGGGMDGGMLSGLLNNILGMGKMQAAPAALGGSTYGNMFQGSSNLGGVATGLFDLVKGMFFDAGGYIGAGNVGIVGERGPEIVRGPAMVTGRKDTAEALGRSSNQINITIQGGANMDKATLEQTLAKAGQRIQRAVARNS